MTRPQPPCDMIRKPAATILKSLNETRDQIATHVSGRGKHPFSMEEAGTDPGRRSLGLYPLEVTHTHTRQFYALLQLIATVRSK